MNPATKFGKCFFCFVLTIIQDSLAASSMSPSASESARRTWLWPTLIVVLLATPIGLLIWIGSGYTVGEEFSPDDFSRRSFAYNRLPGLGWILSKKQSTDLTSDLEKNLISGGFITPANHNPKIWHLCDDSMGAASSPSVPIECDARFLTGYLDLRVSGGGLYWDQWNDDHPKLGKILWPIVAGLARNNRYLKIPDLMRTAMAMESDDVSKFQLLLADLNLNQTDDL
jgi:hypothetical protein